MIFGLVLLFFSIAAMMVSFASAFFLVMEPSNQLILVTSLAGITVLAFLWVGFPLNYSKVKSTWFFPIFIRKVGGKKVNCFI
ncbi:hypothetical protein CFP56_020309 [Quercus suber]|uniref:NADH dehydrogenase subunit 6 n=1 Tax=Quercus suber TaxID=58331 RepID=A0AAW0KGY7_QUESU